MSKLSGTTEALKSFTLVVFVSIDSTPAEMSSYPAVVVESSKILSPLTSKLIDVLSDVIGSSVVCGVMYVGKTVCIVVNGDDVLAIVDGIALVEVFFRTIFVGETPEALTLPDDDEFLLLKRFLPRKMCVVDLVAGSVVASIGMIVGTNDGCAIVDAVDELLSLFRCFFGSHFNTGFSDGFSLRNLCDVDFGRSATTV